MQHKNIIYHIKCHNNVSMYKRKRSILLEEIFPYSKTSNLYKYRKFCLTVMEQTPWRDTQVGTSHVLDLQLGMLYWPQSGSNWLRI